MKTDETFWLIVILLGVAVGTGLTVSYLMWRIWRDCLKVKRETENIKAERLSAEARMLQHRGIK